MLFPTSCLLLWVDSLHIFQNSARDLRQKWPICLVLSHNLIQKILKEFLKSSKSQIGNDCSDPSNLNIGAITRLAITHYYQANPKNCRKNDAIFSIYGRNRIISWHFFEFSLGPFEVVEVNDDQCWILRLRPRNFAIIPETLAPNLEKVK